MTKYLFLLLCSFILLLSLSVCSPQENNQPEIILHRCYHAAGAPENSLAAFTAAQGLNGMYGAEIDVRLTKDDVAVVYHDAHIEGISIENSTYDELSGLRLSNGERLPKLEHFLIQTQYAPQLKLIIEIKSHQEKCRDLRAVELIMQMVQQHGLEHHVEYISFSYDVCKEILKRNSLAIVGYLSGDKPPAHLHEDGIKIMDYPLSCLQHNPRWLREAQDLGMKVNTWAPNSCRDLITAILLGADYITTDNPNTLQRLQLFLN